MLVADLLDHLVRQIDGQSLVEARSVRRPEHARRTLFVVAFRGPPIRRSPTDFQGARQGPRINNLRAPVPTDFICWNHLVTAVTATSKVRRANSA